MKKKLQSIFDTRQYMRSEDFEIFYYEDTNFSGVNSHTHDYYEFYFFLQGDITMYVSNRAFKLNSGDIILIPPDIPHYIANHDSATPYRRFVFWISEKFFRQMQGISSDYTYIVKEAVTKQHFLYRTDIITFNAVQAKLFRLAEEIHSDRFGRASKINLCAVDLVLHLNRLAYEMNHPGTPKESRSLYESLIQYMEDHLDSDLSLDHLANVFYVSKFHIAHIFKENLGLSVHQYITKKRLAMCRDALLGGANISKTFTLYGFKDYSSFFRAFKKEFGLSPKEYKEIHGVTVDSDL